MRAVVVVVIGMLAACGKSGDGKPVHWSKQPLETVTGEIRGIKFSLKVPRGMQFSQDGWRRIWTYHAKTNGKDVELSPKVAIGWIEPWTEMSRLLGSGIDSPLVSRKEQREDGFIYTHQLEGWRDNQHYQIVAQNYVGKGGLICEIWVQPMVVGENTRDYLPQLENVCLSVQPVF